MPMTAKDMDKLLKKNGFEEVSQRGSHLKLRNRSTGYTVTVPMHSGDLKKGLERAILKGTGLNK